MKRGGAALLALFVWAGCQATEPPPEEVPAQRSDVVAALYKQLDATLKRYDALAEDGSEAARREREELLRMAREIRLRIVRFDPNADVRALAEEPGSPPEATAN